MMFCLTDPAQKILRRFLEDQDNPSLFFRLEAEGNACAGYCYSLQVDDESRGSDRVHHFEEIQVRTDEHSAHLFQGVLIDYCSEDSGLHVVSARSLIDEKSCEVSCGSGGCGA